MLLDAQVLIWYALEPSRLSARAVAAIRTPGNSYSSASVWETAIKSGLGKLALRRNGERVSAREFFTFVRDRLQLTPLPVTDSVAAAVENLPWHHHDPFDRLLVAQALEYKLPIVSNDPVFERYGVKRVA